MIVVISKALYKDSNFKNTLNVITARSVSKKPFILIDPNFIIKELSFRLLSYLDLNLKEKVDTEAVGYSNYVGLFNFLNEEPDGSSFKIDNKSYTIGSFENEVKKRLSDLIPYDQIIKNQLHNINKNNYLLIEDDNSEEYLKGYDRKIILKFDKTNKNINYSFEDLIKIRENKEFILINTNDTDLPLKLIMYCSLVPDTIKKEYLPKEENKKEEKEELKKERTVLLEEANTILTNNQTFTRRDIRRFINRNVQAEPEVVTV